MAKLTTKGRRALPSADFANPKERKFPIQDKSHIKAAESYERFATPAEKQKIDAAANKAFPKRGQRTETNKRTRGDGDISHDDWMRDGSD